VGNPKQPALDHNQIRDFYNTSYYKNARPNKKIMGHFSRLASKINIQADQYVLDVACGKGEWLLAVNAMGGIPAGSM
jgi:cyclopropane fatty-acyl-phospholipid synthase-like methyltransferase